MSTSGADVLCWESGRLSSSWFPAFLRHEVRGENKISKDLASGTDFRILKLGRKWGRNGQRRGWNHTPTSTHQPGWGGLGICFSKAWKVGWGRGKGGGLNWITVSKIIDLVCPVREF